MSHDITTPRDPTARIFIITPFVHDYKDTCNRIGIVDAHMRKLFNVIWIDRVEKIYGHKIRKDIDQVIRGDRYYSFSKKEIDQFEMEIVMRSNYL